MKLFPSLWAFRATKKNKNHVPFQEILPLQLKPTVSGKGNKSSEVSCLHEMFLLFACLKAHDFNQSSCMKEGESLQACHITSLRRNKLAKERESKGVLVGGEKKMSYQQTNNLLAKFPNQNK